MLAPANACTRLTGAQSSGNRQIRPAPSDRLLNLQGQESALRRSEALLREL